MFEFRGNQNCQNSTQYSMMSSSSSLPKDGSQQVVQLDPASLLDHMNDDGILDLEAFHNAKTTKKKKRKRNKLTKLPKVALSPSSELLQPLYSTFCALHLSAANISEKDASGVAPFTWKSIQDLFVSLKDDKESWCVETKGKGEDPAPRDFLKPTIAASIDEEHQGYCSFLLQKDTSILKENLEKLPVQKLSSHWSHGDCIWFFFGRNNDRKSSGGETASPLEGRPEHTDSVSHDGTWHFQLSGTKRWFLRPTEELVEQLQSRGFDMDAEQVLQVDCNEGDILVVNTRLWWHRTELPPQKMPSVSYARDFYFSSEDQDGKTKEISSNMTNVDGIYAPKDLEKGEIVFREADMPDCELHRSKEPNCEVVFLEEEDAHAVISIRKIRAGEFFCIGDSDDEEDGDEEVEFDEEEEEIDEDDSGSE